MYYAEADKRKFNIALGERTVVEFVDLVAESGKHGMHQEYVEFELRDGKIFFGGVECPKALTADTHAVRVVLQKTIYDNPKIDGLILFKGGLKDTDYHQLAEQKKEWHSRQLRIALEREKQKKLDAKLSRGIDYESEEARGYFDIWTTQAGYLFGGVFALFVCLIMLVNDS